MLQLTPFLLLLWKRVLPFGRKSNYDVCKLAPKCVRQFPYGFLRAGNHISGRLYEILFMWFLSEIE